MRPCNCRYPGLSRPCRRSPSLCTGFCRIQPKVPAFRAIYAVPMTPVEIVGLQPSNEMLYRAPLFRQASRLTPGEQRARVAAFNGALQIIPDSLQRCSSVTKKDTISCVVELSLQTFKCSLCKSGWGIGGAQGDFSLKRYIFMSNSTLSGATTMAKKTSQAILRYRRGHINPR